jgi:hypothetical protein
MGDDAKNHCRSKKCAALKPRRQAVAAADELQEHQGKSLPKVDRIAGVAEQERKPVRRHAAWPALQHEHADQQRQDEAASRDPAELRPDARRLPRQHA